MNDELVRDIYERMGRMEAKLDDVRAIREKSDEAFMLAQRADHASEENRRDIEQLSATLKWTVGLLVPFVLFVLTKIFGV